MTHDESTGPSDGAGTRRLRDTVVGGLVGAVVGAIVAVNVVIHTGVDRGYEASLPEVFRHSPVVGTVTVVILLAGPMVGAVVARRRSAGRSGS